MLHLMGIFLSLLRLSHQFLMFLHTLPPNITLQSVFSQFIGFKVLAVADPDLLTSPEHCNGKVRNQKITQSIISKIYRLKIVLHNRIIHRARTAAQGRRALGPPVGISSFYFYFFYSCIYTIIKTLVHSISFFSVPVFIVQSCAILHELHVGKNM
jgi:hypothetical protein